MNRWDTHPLWILWRLFTLRHWSRSVWGSLVLLLPLALGVGVFFSVRLANRAALSGFTQFTQAITGESDGVIASPAGRLPETVLPRLREILGDLPVMLLPVVESTATVPEGGAGGDGFDAPQYQLIGIDLIAAGNLFYLRRSADQPAYTAVEQGRSPGITAANAVYPTDTLAQAQGWSPGSRFQVYVADALHELEVAAILPSTELGRGLPDRLLVMDLPALQRLAGSTGMLDRIELFVPDGARAKAVREEALRRLDAPDTFAWVLESPGDRQDAAEQMTAAFRANLTILSGLALLVGTYLILQALEAAVVRRRPEIAVLRSMGVSARSIRTAWLLEALTLGIVGGLLGLAVGYLGAQIAVQRVAQTVNALYVSSAASAAGWHWGEAAVAFGLGIVASVAAGVLPARDAAETPPAHVLRRGQLSNSIRLLDHPALGAALLLAGFLLVRLPPVPMGQGTRFPLAGYVTALCWLVGASIVFSSLLSVGARLLHRFGERSAVFRYAVSQLRRPSGRHKLALAGLVIAVGMASGMGILIHSFERTMQGWIERTLKADLFVACRGVQNASNRNLMQPETWQALRDDPDVAAVDVGHIFPIRFEGAPTFLVGLRLGRGWDAERFHWLHRPTRFPAPGSRLAGGVMPVFVSESFSHRYRKRAGDEIVLPTPAGERQAQIVGIFADYGNERGTILVDPDAVVEWFGDARAVNLAAYLKPGADQETVRRRWSEAHPGVVVRTHGRLRAEVLSIFRQTFAITHALKAIGLFVAVAGLVLSLAGLLMERRRELVTLKEVGMTTRQIADAVAVEGAMVSGLGLAGGLTVSLGLGWLLIFVINKQSFGWTLAYAMPVFSSLLLSALVLASGTGSAWLVGRWGGRVRAEQEE